MINTTDSVILATLALFYFVTFITMYLPILQKGMDLNSYTEQENSK